MDVETKSWYKQEINCPLCEKIECKTLGTRGNREYFGADLNALPHISTAVVKCINCGFIYTNPMIFGMEHLEKLHYNNPEEYQNFEEESILEMFNRRLKYISLFSNKGKLLDVGAGKGEFLSIAKNIGWEVKGVEPSENFCQYAKAHFKIEIKQGFLNSDSFPNERFDLITMNHVLEHVEEPYEFLNVISKYLNKDGLIFIEVPNTNSLLLHLADFYFRLQGLNWSSRLSPLHPPFHKYGYSKKPLKFLLNKCGYQILGVKTFPEADRGNAQRKGKHLAIVLRNFISGIINMFGNRELIVVIAKYQDI